MIGIKFFTNLNINICVVLDVHVCYAWLFCNYKFGIFINAQYYWDF